MSDFFVVLNNKNPKTIRPLLKKQFEIHLEESAKRIHHLILESYLVLSKMKLPCQSTQYLAKIENMGSLIKVTEALTLRENQDDSCVLFISMSNSFPEEHIPGATRREVTFHDAQSTSLALTEALIGQPQFNICAPHQTRDTCLLLLSCTELLANTHRFNVEVTKESSLCFRAMSTHCRTSVIVRTQSWSGISLHNFATRQLQHFSHPLSLH